MMKMKPMVTGVSMAVAAGTLAYAFAMSSSKEKRMLKSRTGKALHAMGDVADVINMMMK